MDYLFNSEQNDGELNKKFVTRFKQVVSEVESTDYKVAIKAFKKGITPRRKRFYDCAIRQPFNQVLVVLSMGATNTLLICKAITFGYLSTSNFWDWVASNNLPNVEVNIIIFIVMKLTCFQEKKEHLHHW